MRVHWIIGALCLVCAFGFLRWMAARAVYYPMRYPQGDWSARDRLGAVDVWLRTSDGAKLNAWWVESSGARRSTLYLHGNAGNITHREDIARVITRAGSSVLLLDYRGYGRSEGSPSEAGLYRDADAAYEWLLARTPATRIVVHGESLGTAVSADLASRRECAGLVLASPFTSARAVASRVLPFVGGLLISGYDSKEKIVRLKAPLLILHGDRDEVIDYAFGRELFDAAPEPKWFWDVRGAGHNDILSVAGPEYEQHLRSFYSQLPQ
jgi:fermentation-respiration switch protein FrsA (DUF1100 family)